MRIISGKFKGKLLVSLSDYNIRPTSDRAKEMIFSTLNSILLKDKRNFIDLSVLDCFCGTGALGIEAKSRGSIRVTFIDSINESLEICKLNCKSLRIFESVDIIKLDFMNDNLDQLNKKFDLFFFDPPYNKFSIDKLMNRAKKIMGYNTYAVLELPNNNKQYIFKDFKIIKKKKISKSLFLFLKKI